MKRIAFYFSFVVLVSLLASCRNNGKSIITPVSSGRPYEVLVVADDNCWMSPDSALYHVLDTDVPGLPQSERSFRISRIRPSHYDRVMRIFRNIIIADIQDIYTQTKFKYARDVYASPQMIMTIQSPSQEDFAEYVSKNGQVIVDFFTRAEMNRQINLMRENIMALSLLRLEAFLTVISGCLTNLTLLRKERISFGHQRILMI